MALADKLTIAGKKLHQDAKGLTGTISYLVPEADMFSPELPLPGWPWPGPHDLPMLRCVEANWSEEECGYWRAEYEYSTERQLGDEFAEVSSDWGVELVDQTKGYTWEAANTVVDIDIPTPIPLIDYTMRLRVNPPPYDAISEALQCVNDRTFRGFAAGCLRFEGASTSESYDIDANIISVQTTYKFTGRKISWLYAWRPPLIARDGNGRERYYQGEDNAKPDYSVALDGQPVYVGGTAGTGGWDRPKLSGAYRYGECNFRSVLNLPVLPGDG